MGTCVALRTNYRVNLPWRPVTRLALQAPPHTCPQGRAQGARPSRHAGYAERYTVLEEQDA